MTDNVKPEIVEGSVLYHGGMAAEVIARSAGQAVIRDSVIGSFYVLDLTTMQDHDYDEWTTECPRRKEWVNIYTDGLGETRHESYERALYGTKNGSIRVAIMERSYCAGRLENVEVHPTEPTLRDGGVDRHNPFAKAA